MSERVDEVVQRSHERTDRLMDRALAILRSFGDLEDAYGEQEGEGEDDDSSLDGDGSPPEPG